MAKTVAQLITAYKAERDALLDQLVADAESGVQPDMSFDGQAIQNLAWRQQIHQRLRELQQILSELEPFEIRQIQM